MIVEALVEWFISNIPDDPNYVAQLVVNGVTLAGLYILLSVGLTLIFGVMHILNLAHGDLMILGAYLTFVMAEMVSFNPLFLLPAVMLVGFVVGVVIQKVAFEPVLEDPVINQLLLSFGLAITIQALMAWYFGPSPKRIRIEEGLGSGFTNLGPFTIDELNFSLGPIFVQDIRLIMLAISAVLLVLLYLLLYKTKIGLQIRAAAQDNTAARVVGIDIERTYVVVMGLGSALAAAAGLGLALYIPFAPYDGVHFVLIGLVIVAIGGLGSMKGAVVAGLMMALIEQLGTLYVDQSVAKGILFLLFLGVILVRPRGMFGSISHGQGLYD